MAHREAQQHLLRSATDIFRPMAAPDADDDGTLRILVVDDVWEDRALTRVSFDDHWKTRVELTQCEYVRQAYTVLNGSAAPYGLMVLDLHMQFDSDAPPGSSTATSFGRWTREHYPTLPIVVLTRNDAEDAVTRCADFSRVVIEKQAVRASRGALLAEAATAALAGEPFIRTRDTQTHRKRLQARYGLSDRHIEHLAFRAQGLTQAAMAERMGLTEGAIVQQVKAIAARIAIVEETSPYGRTRELVEWLLAEHWHPTGP